MKTTNERSNISSILSNSSLQRGEEQFKPNITNIPIVCQNKNLPEQFFLGNFKGTWLLTVRNLQVVLMWKFKNSFCYILVMHSFQLKVSYFHYCSLTLKEKSLQNSDFWPSVQTKSNTFYFLLSSPLTAHEYVLRTIWALCHLSKTFPSCFSFKADSLRLQILELNACSLTSAIPGPDIWTISKRLILNAEEYSNSYNQPISRNFGCH